MNEAALSKKIAAAIRRRGGWAVKIVGGPRQAAGLPDIFVCYRGIFVAFEVKLPGKEKNLTEIQANTLANIKRADGEAHMITTIAQAMAVLDDLDEELQ